MTFWLLLSACRAPAPAVPPVSHEIVLAERGGGLDAPLPTVVALHGLGDAPERFVHSLDGLEGPVRVIAVGAPEPWGDDGHAWWTVMMADNDPEGLAVAVGEAADALVPLLTTLNEREDVCGKPVVTGFSQGGMLSFALASRHADLVAASVPVAGAVFDGVATGPWAPTRALHGTADSRVSYTATKEAVEALAASGADVALASFEGVGHSIPRQVRSAWYATLTDVLPSCEAE